MSDQNPAIDPKENNREAGPEADGLEAVVVDFLRQNPNFFHVHSDLFQALSPPTRYGKGVVDLHQFQSRRLQDDACDLRQQNADLLRSARGNHQVQARVHQAVLAIMEARNFQHFVRIITSELAEVLDVEVVTIGVEGGEDWQIGRVNDFGVFVLGHGEVDCLIEPGQQAVLLSERPTDRGLFGAAATLVRSQALVRLKATVKAPQGLLALGARDARKFQPGKATDLLVFLGAVIESQLRAWLELPA